MSKGARYALAATRIALGWLFLWAFIDKLVGLNFATKPADAWINGGSPTIGFLSHATSGPLADFYHAIAGKPLIDGLFMVGLAAIGLALILGVASRITAAAGILLVLLMYSVVLPPVQNPIIDEHIVFALVFLVLTLTKAGETWGLGKWWNKLSLVKQLHVLV